MCWSVVRSVKGDSRDQTRILRRHGDYKSWNAPPPWVTADRFPAILAPMNVRIREQFWSANEKSANLDIGSTGRLCKYDKDGDSEIRFQGLQRTRFVFSDEVDKLESVVVGQCVGDSIMGVLSPRGCNTSSAD